ALESVFNKLKDNNLSINFEKSIFGQSSISFLGHQISEKGVRPETDSIKDLVIPNKVTRKRLERLIGIVNWFRPYLHNISTRLHPFYQKLKSGKSTITFNESEIKQLNDIFNDIRKRPLLKMPDLNRQFELYCDASEYGIGGILSQDGGIIAFFSSTFKGAESNYTIAEKEMLAIMKAFERFKYLIYNTKTIVFTDNKNIIPHGNLSKRMNRWKLTLQEYDYEIKHIDGKKNKEADLLSRSLLYTIDGEKHLMQEKILLELPKELSQAKIEKNASISPENKTMLLNELHQQLAHPGARRFFETIRRYLKIEGLKQICTEISSNCVVCKREKNYSNSPYTPYKNVKLKGCNDVVALDIKGPISSKHFNIVGQRKYFYILVITDVFSRFTEISLLYDINSKIVAHEFENNWISRYGKPNCCLTDNGRQFTSDSFNELLKKYGIVHSYSSPYNPKGNSIVERINREIGTVLRICRKMNAKNIKRYILRRLNMTQNETIGKTPIEEFLKISIFEKVPISPGLNRKEQEKNTENAIEKRKKQYGEDKKPKIGDFVFIREFSQDKINPIFSGPYRITKVASNNSHVFVQKRNKIVKVSVHFIRPWREGEDVEY
ncbi:Transposon Tf2-9 polyprotein, partial [Dictyocoela roeselum]